MAGSTQRGRVARVFATPIGQLLGGAAPILRTWRQTIAASELPTSLSSLVFRVVKATRLWRSERRAIAEELISHFRDGLQAGDTPEQLMARFGDERKAAVLIRRATRRNRPLIWHLGRCAMTGFAVVLLVYATFFLRFLLSKPNVAVDYLAQLNAPAQAVAPEDRAWPIYRQAMLSLRIARINEDRALVQYYDVPGIEGKTPLADLTPRDPQWPRVMNWLDQHQRGLDLVRQAAGKPSLGFILGPAGSQRDPELGWVYSDIKYSPGHGCVVETLLPMLNALYDMTRFLAADVRYAQIQHDAQRIVADSLALFGIADQTRGPFLAMGVAAINDDDLAFDQIERVLREDAALLSSEQLTQMAHRASAIGGDTAASLLDLSGERATFEDIIQRTYSDDGHGNGLLTLPGARMLPFLCAVTSSGLRGEELETSAKIVETGATAPLSSRRDVMDEFDRNFAEAASICAQPLHTESSRLLREHYQQRLKQIKTSRLLQMRYFPIALFMSDITRDAMRAERLLARRDGIEVGLALELFRREHEAYPMTLAALVPKYLPAVPLDRITGEPLKYRVVKEAPVVYSVGDDRKDDGGRPAIDRSGAPDPRVASRWLTPADKQSPADGDWVLYDPRSPEAATQPAR